MPGAVLNAYAGAMPQAMPEPQCTDGRTDGQDVEPPSQRDHLPLSDACDEDGNIRVDVAAGVAMVREAMGGA